MWSSKNVNIIYVSISHTTYLQIVLHTIQIDLFYVIDRGLHSAGHHCCMQSAQDGVTCGVEVHAVAVFLHALSRFKDL